MGRKAKGTPNFGNEANSFFDSDDILQVRYEMLRRHHCEGVPVVDVAAAFGVSRTTFYQSQAAFNHSGLSGLLPKQRGSKGGYKISSHVVDYVLGLRDGNPAITTTECIQSINRRFGLAIHRRSLERALLRSIETAESNGKPFALEKPTRPLPENRQEAAVHMVKAKAAAGGSAPELIFVRIA